MSPLENANHDRDSIEIDPERTNKRPFRLELLFVD